MYKKEILHIRSGDFVIFRAKPSTTRLSEAKNLNYILLRGCDYFTSTFLPPWMKIPLVGFTTLRPLRS